MNARENPEWPSPGGDDEARLEVFKNRVAETSLRRSAYDVALHESHVAVEAAQLEVLKASVERARDSAKAIQTAATAIATLYTGIGALVFSVGDKQPLPLRGVIPVMFLGAAIVLSTVYLAWLGPAASVGPFPVEADATGTRIARTKWFNNWVSLSVLNKAWALRLSTLYLAAGLVFLPAAFVAVETGEKTPAPSPPPTASWPTPTGSDDGLNRILFKAQVAEVVEARKAAKAGSADGGDGFRVAEEALWIAAGVFFVVAAAWVAAQNKWGKLGDAIKRLRR